MKKVSLLLGIAVCLLLFCGCWDKKELEDNTFAVLLGVDKAEGKDIIVTLAFPKTQTQDGSSGDGMSGSGSYSVMSAKAPTVVEALSLFGTKLSGPLALYTVKTVVISQELAQSDLLRQVFSSWRYEEIRNKSNLLVSQGTAAQFIEARINSAPIDPLRQEELLLEQANGSAYYKPMGLLELLISLRSGSGDGVAMYGGVSAGSEDTKQSLADIAEPVKEGYLPSEIPLSAENQSRISGLAVFSNARMVGALDSAEAQAYSMLTQSKARVVLSLPDPIDPEYSVVASVLPAGKNKIVATINGDTPQFGISVTLKCTVECIQSQVDYTLPQNFDILTGYIQKACADSMSSLIAKAQKEFNADIFNLADKLAHNFATVQEWEAYGWPERYSGAVINLDVTLVIERTGVMLP